MLSEEENRLQKKIDSFGTWMYKFNFTNNVSSKVFREDITEAVETRKKMIFSKLDEMFDGNWNKMKCLDIACSDGHSSFELAKKNVSEIIGFDGRQSHIEKAKFARDYFGYNKIKFFVGDVETIEPSTLGKFDLVFLLGLLYHVENPMLVLRKARNWTKGVCVIETQVTRFDDKIEMGWGLIGTKKETSDSIGILEELTDNPGASLRGISFVPNKSALLKMLKYAGFTKVEILSPHPNAYETYAKFDRVVIVAQ